MILDRHYIQDHSHKLLNVYPSMCLHTLPKLPLLPQFRILFFQRVKWPISSHYWSEYWGSFELVISLPNLILRSGIKKADSCGSLGLVSRILIYEFLHIVSRSSTSNFTFWSVMFFIIKSSQRGLTSGAKKRTHRHDICPKFYTSRFSG